MLFILRNDTSSKVKYTNTFLNVFNKEYNRTYYPTILIFEYSINQTFCYIISSHNNVNNENKI